MSLCIGSSASIAVDVLALIVLRVERWRDVYRPR
jgi:hypothetical protein